MMEIQKMKIAPKLRMAGILIALGLMVELFTLAWNNPIAFLVFLGIGGLLIFLGIVIYLLSLVRETSSGAMQNSRTAP